MLRKFRQFTANNKLISETDYVLLAVSGGVDSVVMTHLIHQCGFKFAIAHCNFRLRGKDSDVDASFTKELAKNWNVPYFEKSFDTEKYAQTHGISLQMAARDLRFNWFNTLLIENKFDILALAHNKNDVAETILINLIRGTGISGLHGILPKNNRYIRPLLFAQRHEIEAYAKKNNIAFRSDKSNFEDKYIRNNLRLNIIPLLQQINPSLIETLNNTAQYINHIEQIYHEKLKEIRSKTLKEEANKTLLDKHFFSAQSNSSAYLFAFLNDYGFNTSQISQIKLAITKSPGKIFISTSHRLLIDREHLIIEPIPDLTSDDLIEIEENTESISTHGLNLSLCIINPNEINALNKTAKNICYLDFEKLKFPLQLRTWQQKDKFIPLGMKQKKKLSDFLIDEKINMFDKERINVLKSNNVICWVVGHRLDERFKILPSTRKVLKIEIL